MGSLFYLGSVLGGSNLQNLNDSYILAEFFVVDRAVDSVLVQAVVSELEQAVVRIPNCASWSRSLLMLAFG